MSEHASVTITQQTGYQFLIDFGVGIPQLLADEPVPMGAGEGPTPNHLLLAGVANCLSASLFFALQKFKQDPGGIQTTATAKIERNAEKRLRIEAIEVSIRLGKNSTDIENLERVLSQFESFCTVSQSVQQGIPISIAVQDGQGKRVK